MELTNNKINLEQAINLMKDAGLKATKQRIFLLEILFKNRDVYESLTDLAKMMRQKFIKMSNETIYRNVKDLEEIKIVETRLFANGLSVKFQCDFNNTKHAHFICELCGKIVEIKQPNIESIISELPEFQIKKENFELIGTCDKCTL